MMTIEKIHADSADCAHSELDLFVLPPTAGQIERSSYVTCQPLGATLGDVPLEFISKGTSEYVDLAKSYLRLRIKVTQGGGTDLVAATNVAPVNNIAHSLFSQLDLYLNEQLVSSSNTMYPYRSYLEALLNHGTDARDSQLVTSMFHMDTAGQMDAVTDLNLGFKKRKGLTSVSKPVELLTWINSDMFHQDRFLLNNVDLRIRLTRTKPEFYLHSNAPNARFRIQIDEATLYVRKVKVSDSVLLAHAQLLASGKTVKYPLNRVDLRSFSVGAGLSSINKDNIFPGQVPRRVIVGLVDSGALNGTYASNPFNFQHFNANFVALYVDDQTVPSPALTPDFENNQYARSYFNLLDNTSIWRNDKGLVFNQEQYKNGYALFAFDLTPDGKKCMDYFTLIRQANVRLEIKFAQPLANPVAVVVYAEYENLLEIDAHGRINFDYSS